MQDIQFKVRYTGNYSWSTKGEKITDPVKIERIEDTFEDHGAVILRHWHFYGSSAPSWIVIEDYEDLIEYLSEKAIAGDIIDLWSLYALCSENNMIASGKCPDQHGRVPERGAY